MWMGELYYWSCLSVLSSPDWVLLSYFYFGLCSFRGEERGSQSPTFLRTSSKCGPFAAASWAAKPPPPAGGGGGGGGPGGGGGGAPAVEEAACAGAGGGGGGGSGPLVSIPFKLAEFLFHSGYNLN